MNFKKLSLERQKRFAATNKKLGLPAEQGTHTPVDHPKNKTIIYSSDPEESDVPPKLVTVNSIADLRKMLGFDDASQMIAKKSATVLTANLKALESIHKIKTANLSDGKPLKDQLSTQQKAELKTASVQLVTTGAPELEKYESLLNEVQFPMKMAVFSDPAPKVIDGTAVIKSGKDGLPVTWNYSEIIMGPEGKIRQETDFIMVTDSLESSNGATGDLPINNTPPDYSEPAPEGGTSGPPGQAGGGTAGVAKANNSKKGCPIECYTPPGDGKPGTQGADGGDGSPGQKGGAMSSLTITINEKLTGKIIIQAGGGNGQVGGKGGKGADGGEGGPPGSCPTQCTAANKGPQGPGGQGGMGGNGGDGGDVGVIIIKLPFDMAQPPVDLTPVGGKGGNNGSPGEGGLPGGKPGDTNPHTPNPSPAPQVIFQRLPPN